MSLLQTLCFLSVSNILRLGHDDSFMLAAVYLMFNRLMSLLDIMVFFADILMSASGMIIFVSDMLWLSFIC